MAPSGSAAEIDIEVTHSYMPSKEGEEGEETDSLILP